MIAKSQSRKIRIYAEKCPSIMEDLHREYVPPYVPLLNALWQPCDADEIYSAFNKIAARCYEQVNSPADCDFMALPFGWNWVLVNERAAAFARQQISIAEANAKKIVIFFDSDDDRIIDWPDCALVFRFSLYSDKRKPQEFAIPHFSRDLMLASQSPGLISVRTKNPIPIVSFAGYSPPHGCTMTVQTAKEYFRYFAYKNKLLNTSSRHIGHAPRSVAISNLMKSQKVRSSFILRPASAFNHYGALLPGGTNETAVVQIKEFAKNIVDSDYVVCARGWANSSMRLYETMSLGRIPVFVNTNSVLPFEHAFDWKSCVLWVEHHDLSHVDEIISEFHESLSPNEFIEMQRRCRSIFEKYLSAEGFLSNAPAHILGLRSRPFSLLGT